MYVYIPAIDKFEAQLFTTHPQCVAWPFLTRPFLCAQKWWPTPTFFAAHPLLYFMTVLLFKLPVEWWIRHERTSKEDFRLKLSFYNWDGYRVFFRTCSFHRQPEKMFIGLSMCILNLTSGGDTSRVSVKSWKHAS